MAESQEAQASKSVMELLRLATGYLADRGIQSPRLDAEVLLAHILGLSRIELYVNFDRPLEPQEVERYRSVVAERGRHKPVAYIIGQREFYSLPFRVGPATLVPRPDTETLVEVGLEWIRKEALEEPTVVDLGTGSGAIAVSLSVHVPRARIHAVDISASALAIAGANADLNGVADRIRFHQGSWFDPLSDLGLTGRVDLVISNPPYIPDIELASLPSEVRLYEPAQALFGGPDGLEPHRQILSDAASYLRDGGRVMLEIGPAQADTLRTSAAELPYTFVEVRKDYAGRDRVVSFQYVAPRIEPNSRWRRDA